MRKIMYIIGIIGLLSFGRPAHANGLYVSQNGGGNGSSCASAFNPAWFNNSANWGSGQNQIGPGTTVHLCGTFTGAPGQQLLAVQGSGTQGNPITIKFEAGAVLTAPYWSAQGAIYAGRVAYITIDGWGHGVIQNTANGTNLSYQHDSRGVYAPQCTSCTVQNITIANLYVRTSVSDVTVTQTAVNCVYWLNSDNFTANNVTCHDAGWAFAGFGNSFTLEHSEIYNIDHGLAFGPPATASNFSIHDNHIHDFTNWDSTTNAYHHDGLHIWGQRGGAVNGGSIYNNLFDGDSGVNITADIYLQDSISNVSVYNNVFIVPSNRTNNVLWFAALSTTGMPGGPATGNSAYNNFISAGGHAHGTAMFVEAQVNFTAVNNVLMGGQSDITLQSGGSLSANGINHNVYLELADFSDRNTFGYLGHVYQTLSDWQKICGCDANSSLVSASKINVGTLGQLLSGSVGLGTGQNLMNVAQGVLTPLATDRLGDARPTSGPWDVGPYQSGAKAAQPAAPAGLTAIVH
jgi:hypothetical protein